ncbi:hypothetical protein ACJ73_08427, partial [Blastomyces percursus]
MECRPWPEIDSCFVERTESVLRQWVSTLQKQRGEYVQPNPPVSQQHLPAPEVPLSFSSSEATPVRHRYITREAETPAHHTSMCSPLLLYTVRSHGRMIPML